MENYRQMARRVASTEVVAASLLFGAQRPSDLFGATFFDIRQKAKDLKEDWSQKAKTKLEKALKADMKAKKVPVSSFQISLGKYRGSRFVTSAKLRVKMKDEKSAQNLLKYLQSKFSPKFKLKNYDSDSGEAYFNVR